MVSLTFRQWFRQQDFTFLNTRSELRSGDDHPWETLKAIWNEINNLKVNRLTVSIGNVPKMMNNLKERITSMLGIIDNDDGSNCGKVRMNNNPGWKTNQSIRFNKNKRCEMHSALMDFIDKKETEIYGELADELLGHSSKADKHIRKMIMRSQTICDEDTGTSYVENKRAATQWDQKITDYRITRNTDGSGYCLEPIPNNVEDGASEDGNNASNNASGAIEDGNNASNNVSGAIEDGNNASNNASGAIEDGNNASAQANADPTGGTPQPLTWSLGELNAVDCVRDETTGDVIDSQVEFSSLFTTSRFNVEVFAEDGETVADRLLDLCLAT